MSKKSFFRQSHYIVRRFLPSNRFQKLRKVVFGISVFDVKSDFIKEKRLPIVWKYDFGKRFLQYVMRFTFR
ncbi:hypothetical protein DXD43_06320 [Bifidobacterium pseudocatenulatum]|nr:hypothetical protein DXD43_06320 [Bifidobacterium pseudocatenulatum]